MHIEQFNIINFKNIESSSLNFSKKFNCFVGDNAAGKSNFLDSIYYLSMCKSAFGATDRQLINRGKEFFVVDGEYRTATRGVDMVGASYRASGAKRFSRNEKEYQRLSEHIGNFPIVMISPFDNEIIQESGEQRRKYLNLLISQIDRPYLNNLMRYNQILAQRNSLLKGKADNGLLEIINLQLSEYGDKIYAKRREIIELVAPRVEHYYNALCRGRERISVTYNSKLEGSSMLQLLDENLSKDLALNYTSAGVHRDDIKLEIDGYAVRKFGSQGQQKSFIIALKLAQFDVISQSLGIKPILLLDDIFDKLDASRVEALITLVRNNEFGQIFISDCNRSRLKSILDKASDDYMIYSVENGRTVECKDENQYL